MNKRARPDWERWAARERARRDWEHRPWRKKPDWPPGAVVAATLFHLIGGHNLAEKGLVFRPVDWMAYAILMIGPLALFWRRRAPVPVFVVAAVPSLVAATQAAPHFSYAVAPAIALFTASRAGRMRAAMIAAAVSYLGYLLVVVVLGEPLGLDSGTRPALGQAVLAAVGLGGAVILGAASKVHTEHLAEITKARAEQARAKEEQEKRQASEERLRIAQELHDVLGHHLSLINVQAGVGLHLMDNRPEQAREALTAIKSASAEALREVRAVLGVLRTEGEAAPRQPALGLNRLDELTAGAGIPVRTAVNGEPRELPAEVDRAAYRIVQEALTNVRRHAAGPDSGAEVTVGYLPAVLHLSIRNSGPPPNGDSARGEPAAGDPAGGLAEGEVTPGSGITGMRARAEALAGRFAAGRLPEGGFLVSVVLPAPATTGPADGESTGGGDGPSTRPGGGDGTLTGPAEGSAC
jgi:signal transduction histidine kinase